MMIRLEVMRGNENFFRYEMFISALKKHFEKWIPIIKQKNEYQEYYILYLVQLRGSCCIQHSIIHITS